MNLNLMFYQVLRNTTVSVAKPRCLPCHSEGGASGGWGGEFCLPCPRLFHRWQRRRKEGRKEGGQAGKCERVELVEVHR